MLIEGFPTMKMRFLQVIPPEIMEGNKPLGDYKSRW